MILNERNTRHEQVLQIGKQMMVAARTAPKAKGVDIIEVALITDEDIHRLEKAIDEADALLPPLKAFVIPGGSRGSAVCQVCRTVCRRAERRILAMAEEHEVTENVSAFVNRLSDYLFVLARKMNILAETDEIYWDKSCI